MISRTDEELLRASQKGDSDAFRDIVKRYEPRVAATVIGMLGHCPEAEDVGQETFIRFYKSIPSFRGDSSVATFLTRIAINLSLNEIKRRKRKNLFFVKSTDDVENIPAEKSFNDGEMKNLVQQSILKLEPKFRTVIVLRLIEGYSTKETAKILKLPQGTVLSRLARAQQKLRKILDPVLGDDYE